MWWEMGDGSCSCGSCLHRVRQYHQDPTGIQSTTYPHTNYTYFRKRRGRNCRPSILTIWTLCVEQKMVNYGNFQLHEYLRGHNEKIKEVPHQSCGDFAECNTCKKNPSFIIKKQIKNSHIVINYFCIYCSYISLLEITGCETSVDRASLLWMLILGQYLSVKTISTLRPCDESLLY